mmetsp:Transcript_9917/g.14613  ORF Transcript_9917/g.14613 Transcript_9917/m.14613 type:complete len:219 (-) Transcript_9917:202-858(-)
MQNYLQPRWLIFISLLIILPNYTSSFAIGKSLNIQRCQWELKAKKVKKVRPSISGFGGAAAESCPCGSDISYMKCCGKLHKNINDFQKATPEQVVRARYTAYAKREIDFIIKSTHPMNKNFDANIKHWRSQIDMNCYDNFELTRCQILEEILVDDKTATVAFVANMVQRDSRERTSFKETSTFEKIGGVWLYKEGIISDPPGRPQNHDSAGRQQNESK